MPLLKPSLTLTTAFFLFSLFLSSSSHARAVAVQAGPSHDVANRGAPKESLLAQAAESRDEKPPKNALDYFADGVEAMDMQDFQAAERSFHQALALEPENKEFQYYLAVAYSRVNKSDKALQIFESLLENDPKNYFKAYFDIAAVYSRQGRYQKALDVLNLAEQAEPTSARVYIEKGAVTVISHVDFHV